NSVEPAHKPDKPPALVSTDQRLQLVDLLLPLPELVQELFDIARGRNVPLPLDQCISMDRLRRPVLGRLVGPQDALIRPWRTVTVIEMELAEPFDADEPGGDRHQLQTRACWNPPAIAAGIPDHCRQRAV